MPCDSACCQRCCTWHAGTDYKFARRLHCNMKLPVLGGMTQAEGVSLGAFSTSGNAASDRQMNVNLGAHGVLLENGVMRDQFA